ncbi:MAG: hypothetical protein AABX73_03825 [Nanoarchaeota archaeon]|mgnify:CR=1 FL=1
MAQNRNKLIELFIGNISNAIAHKILERAATKEILADKYRKELVNSFEIAKRYREKINPSNRLIPDKDAVYIKEKVIARVKAELMTRISKGYENIDLELIDTLTNKTLKDTKIIL